MRFVFLILVLFSIQTFAVKIQVLDAETKLPIPYVSYVHVNDKKGSYADENGLINIEDKLNEEYSLSCVGYSSVKFIPNEVGSIVYLKPLIKQLNDVTIRTKNKKYTPIQIGQIKKNSFTPYYSSIPGKMIMLTYLPPTGLNKEKGWLIENIKIGIGGRRSKIYKAFLIRLLIKEEINGLPGKDLLSKDWVVKIEDNSFGYEFKLEESQIMPKNGCFVGFETIGKIRKDGSFIPFTDIFVKPEKPFQFDILLIKSDGFSLTKRGGYDAWFKDKEPGDQPDTYAIAIDVVEVDPDQ